MAASISTIESGSSSSHAIFRPVQPGNWQGCYHCLETIEFVPGAGRTQVTCKTYRDGTWLQVEHYHPDCYAESGHPTYVDSAA